MFTYLKTYLMKEFLVTCDVYTHYLKTKIPSLYHITETQSMSGSIFWTEKVNNLHTGTC